MHLTTKQLVAYHENVLPPAKQQLYAQHLQHCSSCQAEWRILQELDAAWQNPAPDGFSRDIIDSVMLDIEQLPLPKPMQQLPTQSRKMRTVHVLLAGAATFLFLQSDLIQYISRTDDYVTHTIEQTSSFTNKLPLWHNLTKLMEGIQ